MICTKVTVIICCHTSLPGRLHDCRLIPRWDDLHFSGYRLTGPEDSIWPVVWKNKHQITEVWKANKKKKKKNQFLKTIRGQFTLCLTLNDVYYMSKLIFDYNSDGWLFSNKITFNRIIHLIGEVLMIFFIENGSLDLEWNVWSNNDKY